MKQKPKDVEKRLKDYKGYHVWKYQEWEYSGYRTEYWACNEDDEIINVFKSLEELKEWCS